MTLNHPGRQPCARTHARIMAHCSMRHSVGVGATMREMVGRAGDIAALPTATLASRFTGIRLDAALYGVGIAEYSKTKRRNRPDQAEDGEHD